MDLKISSDDVMMAMRYKRANGNLSAIYECEACKTELYSNGDETVDGDRHTVTRCLERLHERIGSLRVEVMPDIR